MHSCVGYNNKAESDGIQTLTHWKTSSHKIFMVCNSSLVLIYYYLHIFIIKFFEC